MCARIDVLSTAGVYATDYVRKNPKATEMEVLVAVREHLQDLRKNGDKVSAKGLSQVASTVREIYTAEQAKANLAPITTPTVQRAAKRLNANAAVNHYEQVLGMGDGARKKWHQKNMADAKQAFASEEYLEVLKRNNPAEYEKEVARLKAENEVVSNNAGKKEANAEYQSSKKKKVAKKSAETASHAEHRRQRIKNSKPAREARWMTANGKMKTAGRKLYQALNAHEIIVDAPWKSAEASARVFEEHGLSDFERSLSDSKPVAVASAPTKPASVTTASSATAQSAAQSATKATEKAAESAAETAANAAKKAGKGKWGWIAVGVGVVAAAIGGKDYLDKLTNKKAEQEKLNLSA